MKKFAGFGGFFLFPSREGLGVCFPFSFTTGDLSPGKELSNQWPFSNLSLHTPGPSASWRTGS